MGGGLMQLVAYGAQDIYLTGNPQITFFKVVYRRHTNFAMEAIEQTFNGVANWGNKVVCTIARNGDLVGRMLLEIDLGEKVEATDNDHVTNQIVDNNICRIGHKLIKSAEVEIGGQRIDKHYGEWLDVWNQLNTSTHEWAKLTEMVSGNLTTYGSDHSKVYVPLQFWFNRNPGLALPLIALQYHEVKVSIEFAKKDHCGTEQPMDNVCLFCDYIFLDTDERRRFAQVSHEYLIEQLQTTGTCTFNADCCKATVPLNFNHPCKELVWVCQSGETVEKGGKRGTYDFSRNGVGDDTEQDFIDSAVLQLNGHDRFRARHGSYFRLVQPYQHHGNAPTQDGDSEQGHIYTYSFGLKPEEHQPSGTCNFSRIDNAVLNMTLNSDDNATDVRVYATNYNVLRVMSGMGGLAYSN